MKHWRLHPTLPIFGLATDATYAAFVPGHVMPATARLLAALQGIWCDGLVPTEAHRGPLEALQGAAADAVATWDARHREAFRPVCLNVQLPYACNLACGYCYARGQGAIGGESLCFEAVTAAARLVAANCAASGAPFQLIVQGLGEPTQRWEDLQAVVAVTQATAAAAGVPWQGHVSTNGQGNETQVAWLAANFDHVTLSCDGGPEIQDRQRPRRDGSSSSTRLRETARILARSRTAVEARVTVTAANALGLPGVLRYLADELCLREARLEPVFGDPAGAAALPAPDRLAQLVLEAGRVGGVFGITARVASPDLTRLHGEYCEALRQTLRLRPDGFAVNCLHGCPPSGARADALGKYIAASDTYALDQAVVARTQDLAGQIPSTCQDCPALYHCSRSCPDACPQVGGSADYRCRFQRALLMEWVLEAAGSDRGRGGLSGGFSTSGATAREAAEALPPCVDRQALLTATQRASRLYDLTAHRMPTPAWAGPDALHPGATDLADLLATAQSRRGPISVYVHVPFCRGRCLFCDCHAVSAVPDLTVQRRYVDTVLRDLEHWCTAGGMAARPVTTIHFGGGTPSLLAPDLWGQLVTALRVALGVTPTTEWAVETTVAAAGPEQLAALKSLGFSRLHVGVQTLQDDLRRQLGRRTDAATALSRLEAAMSAGFVTSADLLYGLPEQGLASLLTDVDALTGIGLHGCSLYRLSISERNRSLFRRFPGFVPDPLADCLALQAAEAALLEAGYGKNHYVHYALPPDADLYFRHAIRGEDLLALGASAAGSVGPWQYRCYEYPRYLTQDAEAWPMVMLARDPQPQAAATLGAALMGGEIAATQLAAGPYAGLRERWLEAGVVRAGDGRLALTALGSWLIGVLLDELATAATTTKERTQ